MSNRTIRLLVIAALVGAVGLALAWASRRWLEPRLEAVAAGVDRSAPSLAVAAAQGDIERDAETMDAIARTRAVALPSHAESPIKLVVTKSRARLDLVNAAGSLLKTYPVALGGRPVGAKEREGDERTPEGHYLLLPHHESPAFGPCFYVCYPNAGDAGRGKETGLIDARDARRIRRAQEGAAKPPHSTNLGGLILLHGTRDRSRGRLTASHWTLGCIAMENGDLEELLRSFGREDRPTLEIRP